MRRMRFLAIAVISFVAALFGTLLSPSTWLHKSLAVALCGVLSANPALCTNNAIAVHSQDASATNPVKVETTQFSDLLAQRSRDFDDDTPKSPPRANPNNPQKQSYPTDSGGGPPQRSREFDRPSPEFDDAINNAAKNSALDLEQISNEIDKYASQSAESAACKFLKKNSRNRIPLQNKPNNQSPTEQNICKNDGKYAVFAKHPLQQGAQFIPAAVAAVGVAAKRPDVVIGIVDYEINKDRRNIELAHEHIFFCDNGKITRNIGFGPNGQFSYTNRAITQNIDETISDANPNPITGKGKVDDFRPIDQMYDSDLMNRVLARSNVCTSYKPGAYVGVGNNCQNFAEEMRKKFDQKLQSICNQPIAKISDKNKTGSSYGDPHIVTFDGYRYSFQTVGEFTLVKSTDRSFEVQVRQSPVPGAQLSLNSAVAIKSGNSRIAIYGQSLPDSDTSTPIRVDGRPFPAQGGTLPNGTVIAQQGQGSYIIQTTSGEVVSVRKTSRNNLSYMDVNPSIPDVSGRYTGLLGNSNGNPKDDLQTRSGQVIETQSTYGQIAQTASSFIPGVGRIAGLVSKVENIVFDQLYKEFGNSWRISQAESLFDYKAGQNTDTFTDRGFPSSYRTLAMLSPAQVEAATAACQQSRVPAEQLEGCIFDVGFTGDSGFAETASQALEIVNMINQLVPNAIPLPKLPISIPGLPF